MNDNYYPYELEPAAVETGPQEQVPVENAPVSVMSPDGTRMVQVTGEKSYAALYAKVPSGFKFLKVLAQDVENVKFLGGTPEKPLMIMVGFSDARFALFDADGKTLDMATVSGASKVEPPADSPDSLPPLPDSAPGK